MKNNTTQRWERVFEYDIQKDQNFHDIEPPFRIDQNQDVAIRCTYDSSKQTKTTLFGTDKNRQRFGNCGARTSRGAKKKSEHH